VDVEGLRCFYSVVGSLGLDAQTLKRDALEFHQVTRELFRQAALIPFRFPATLASVAQIAAFMQEHAPAYRAALADFRDKVQMEIRIRPPEPPAAGAASSGTKYLKDRAQRARRVERAIAACRAAVHEEVVDWRQRESSHGVRCFALVRRDAVSRFQQQVQRVRLEDDLTATLSGPWPPTEFLPAFDG
jgi:Gas vesicle synthesis protein GvpL/GvpF